MPWGKKNGETGHHNQTPVCILTALPPLGTSPWVHVHACGQRLCFKRPDHLTHMRKRHAFYTRLQFLGRNGGLCPWSAHRTLFNINVLFKNASFTSKVARWAALEPTGKPQGPEWSRWLLFITRYWRLPRVKTSSTSWQRRGVSSYSPASKRVGLVWPRPPNSWKDTNTRIFLSQNFVVPSLAPSSEPPIRAHLHGSFSDSRACVL